MYVLVRTLCNLQRFNTIHFSIIFSDTVHIVDSNIIFGYSEKSVKQS